MKQVLIFTIILCCSFLIPTAQVPSFEYVAYQQDNRKATVTLPDFTVPLKRDYQPENPTHKEVKKIFVVSDIEGQYEIFKKLLLAAGVMDPNFNWTFGKGHLVINGDVFDRGDQVTECLWLIYLLEGKATKKGGYVHYILGNHEVMNMNGDLRFLNPKYLNLAQQKAVPYTSFYSEQTELGRWLRTKNIIEKIGNLLMMHGGVSQYMNQLAYPIDSINNTARTYYDQPDDSLPPLPQLLLLDYGPSWYRGYVDTPLATATQVDSTLKLFRVKKIIVGHTPVPRISSLYGGKVIDVDVPHAKGVSEGLLIDNKKYYRIGIDGKKEPLPET
jgi:hypothetical protein